MSRLHAIDRRSTSRRRLDPRSRNRRIHRIRFEILEDRRLLSTVTWVATSSGNWDVGSNWSTGQVPGPSDDVVINAAAALTVTINSGNQSVNSIQSGSNATLSLSAGSLAVTTGAEVDGGFQISGNVTISGSFSGGAGAVSQFSSGTLTTGSGGATVNFPDFQWLGGSIEGTLSNAGSMTWSNGTVVGDVSNAGTITLTGGTDLTNCPGVLGQLSNAGTIIQHTGDLALITGDSVTVAGSVVNLPGAIYDIEVAGVIGVRWSHSGNPTPEFDNQGTLSTAAGSGAAEIGPAIVQPFPMLFLTDGGTIDVESGSLIIGTSASTTGGSGGSFTVASGAVLDLNAGSDSAQWSGTYTGSGSRGCAVERRRQRGQCHLQLCPRAVSVAGGQYRGDSQQRWVDKLERWDSRGEPEQCRHDHVDRRDRPHQLSRCSRPAIQCEHDHPADRRLGPDHERHCHGWRILMNLPGGVYNLEVDGVIGVRWSHGDNPVPEFDNQGTLLTSAGTGVATIGPSFVSYPFPMTFDNSGTTEVSSGTLSIGAAQTTVVQVSGSVLTGGSWDIFAGAHPQHHERRNNHDQRGKRHTERSWLDIHYNKQSCHQYRQLQHPRWPELHNRGRPEQPGHADSRCGKYVERQQ